MQDNAFMTSRGRRGRGRGRGRVGTLGTQRPAINIQPKYRVYNKSNKYYFEFFHIYNSV